MTDCLSVHDQLNLMVQRNRLDPEWSHLDWWNALFLVYTRRTVFSSNPLSLRWCPAHKLEHLNDDLIAESMARKYNTARIDLIRNRQADRAAKKALRLTCFPDFNNWNIRQSRISQWQVWLAKIAALVGETSTKDPATRPPPLHKIVITNNQSFRLPISLSIIILKPFNITSQNGTGSNRHPSHGNLVVMLTLSLNLMLLFPMNNGNKVCCSLTLFAELLNLEEKLHSLSWLSMLGTMVGIFLKSQTGSRPLLLSVIRPQKMIL